jgi:hypothetical protein
VNAKCEKRSSKLRTRIGLALAIGMITVLSTSGVASASVTKNLTVTHAKETDKKWCVPASVWMELKQQGLSSPTQSSLYQEGLPLKRCNINVDSGLDPLAWAWLLYNHTPSGYYYDDFTYTSAKSGSLAMADQLYAYGEVAGALVNEGHHAMVFKGVATSCNLDLDSCWMGTGPTISTVYVDDPWFDWNTNTPGKDADGCPGTGGTYQCGKIGLQPNTAIAYATWATYYYTPWGHQPSACSYWNGKWVSVLRKTSQTFPSAAILPGGLKDPAFGPTPDPEPGIEYPTSATQGATVVANSTSITDLDGAFAKAKTANGLTDRHELADALDGGHITATTFVRSLVQNFPDYLLANVVGHRGLRGVAMFTLADPTHPEFAGMTVSDDALGHYPLVSPGEANQALADLGLKALDQPELVWGWSVTTNSPYYPLWSVSTSGGNRFVTSMGQVIEDPELQATPRS